MKKFLALVTSIIICFLLSVNVFAQTKMQMGPVYVFEQSQTPIEYYLDSNGNPYQVENGKKIHLLLPLEENEITDKKTIQELNSLFEEQNAVRSAPTSYVDISGTVDSAQLISQSYHSFMDLETYYSITTPVLKLNSKLVKFNVKTTNMRKSLFSPNTIMVTISFYNTASDTWHWSTYENDYTGAGEDYTFPPDLVRFARCVVTQVESGVKSFDFYVHTHATA